MNMEIFTSIIDSKYSEDATNRSDMLEACEEAFLLGQMSMGGHDSDCSLHNAPAMKVKPCDCSRKI